MKRLNDWLLWGAARLGWPGLLGLALLAGALGACLGAVHPMEAEAQRLRQQAAARAAQPLAAAPVKVRDWRADLPADHEAYARLKQLFQAAEAAGLTLDEGNYRTQRDAASGLTRLLIGLPVGGGYPEVRAFLAQALNQDPAVALEGIDLSREDMASTELVAELRFALYLGGRP
ncbi:MAG: hypothetical protein AB1831_03765 [Pseudomonadota bacterium]